jgi:hypothetical protein
MRSYFVIALTAVWLALCGGSDRSMAQTVHAILVADTLDSTIGAGVAENKANITSFLGNVKT